jgi:hypothetical protein
MKLVRIVSEDQVIGEFLKNEFYESNYNRDRDLFEQIVLEPNYDDAAENAIRRALLFRRRGHMWRELPDDTTWWQVEIEHQDLSRIHVFPRAQWRKISNGSFCLKDIVQRIQSKGYRNGAGEKVTAKLQQLRYRIATNACPQSTILLIGLDENRPVTILEGNHRLAAAMLVSAETVRTRFRIMCGFSPNMTKSCWYRTNFPNLFHYALHRLANLHDREADLRRIFPEKPAAVPAQVSPLAVEKLTGTQS